MILADTSVWIDHFRTGNAELSRLLTAESILLHPFILGELACGNLRQRAQTLADLNTLPKTVLAAESEVHELIVTHRLLGRGIGWMDAHLLASALLSHCSLWTLDARLAKIARELKVAVP